MEDSEDDTVAESTGNLINQQEADTSNQLSDDGMPCSSAIGTPGLSVEQAIIHDISIKQEPMDWPDENDEAKSHQELEEEVTESDGEEFALRLPKMEGQQNEQGKT